jgi:hypothetical protein
MDEETPSVDFHPARKARIQFLHNRTVASISWRDGRGCIGSGLGERWVDWRDGLEGGLEGVLGVVGWMVWRESWERVGEKDEDWIIG